MGRRSRKRSSAAGQPAAGETRPQRPAPPPIQTTRGPKARPGEAPKAPWSPFPLVELTILLGLILIGIGFFGSSDRRGVFLGCGFALVSLAALELSLREHLSGYRSHSALLAGVCAVIADVPLFLLTRAPQTVLLAVGVAVFGGAFVGLRAVFRRRTGGTAFRA